MARIIKAIEIQGQPANVLFDGGAVNTMERWEIKLDPKAGGLDLEGLRRREFTEF